MWAMELIGPYRLLRVLGVSEAGSVWSGYDTEGTSVTVAVIDQAHANDPGWLRGFQARMNDLAYSGDVGVVSSDLTGSRPWVACAWDDSGPGAARVFLAQGLSYVASPRVAGK